MESYKFRAQNRVKSNIHTDPMRLAFLVISGVQLNPSIRWKYFPSPNKDLQAPGAKFVGYELSFNSKPSCEVNIE
jgi:hypothetical protein